MLSKICKKTFIHNLNNLYLYFKKINKKTHKKQIINKYKGSSINYYEIINKK